MALWSQMFFQDAYSPTMIELIKFHDLCLVVMFLIVSILCFFLTMILMNKFTTTSHFHANSLEVFWTVVPAVILFFLAIPSLRLLYFTDELVDPKVTLKIMGHQWYWSYEYNLLKNQISFDSFMTPEQNLDSGDFRLLATDWRAVPGYLDKNSWCNHLFSKFWPHSYCMDPDQVSLDENNNPSISDISNLSGSSLSISSKGTSGSSVGADRSSSCGSKESLTLSNASTAATDSSFRDLTGFSPTPKVARANFTPEELMSFSASTEATCVVHYRPTNPNQSNFIKQNSTLSHVPPRIILGPISASGMNSFSRPGAVISIDPYSSMAPTGRAYAKLEAKAKSGTFVLADMLQSTNVSPRPAHHYSSSSESETSSGGREIVAHFMSYKATVKHSNVIPEAEKSSAASAFPDMSLLNDSTFCPIKYPTTSTESETTSSSDQEVINRLIALSISSSTEKPKN